jgi:hypothetical protein
MDADLLGSYVMKFEIVQGKWSDVRASRKRKHRCAFVERSVTKRGIQVKESDHTSEVDRS